MNNNNDNQNSSGQVTIIAQYIKDKSFENPNAPVNLTALKTQPAIELNLDLSAKALSENNYEVAMQIKAKAASEDKVLFLVDLTYAGLFLLDNIPEEHKEFILLVQCPSIIFPFARRIIADDTRDGGFQPLMIDPVDFSVLYARKKQQDGSSNLN
ncbi:MAG: protein-export chaperone SecB [Alphaproteobacteria bacterium]